MESENGKTDEKWRIVIEYDVATNKVNIMSNINNEVFMVGLMITAQKQMDEHNALLRLRAMREKSEKEIIAPPPAFKVQ